MENSPETQSNKWLIIFLIYADFTTNEKLPMIEKMKVMVNSMLGDIITTPIDNNQTRMFVIMNSIKYIFGDQENKIDDRTAFFPIVGDKKSGGNVIGDCELVDNNCHYKKNEDGILILQKAEQLESVLNKTNVQPNEEVFLITWDHGSGFGIFRKEIPTLDQNSVRTEINKDLFQYSFIKLFWNAIEKKDEEGFLNKKLENTYTTVQAGHTLMKVKNSEENKRRFQYYSNKKKAFVYNDKAERIRVLEVHKDELAEIIETKGSLFRQKSTSTLADGFLQNELHAEPKAAEVLTNSELNDGLKKWQEKWPENKEKKVGVLLMSNCWMMNLHTMYALKDTVKCLVAPQGGIDVPGYNLKDIITKINESADVSLGPSKLAKTCVKTIDNGYSKAKAIILDRTEPDVLELFKVFAVDLSKTTDGENTLVTHILLLKGLIHLLVEQLSSDRAKRTEMKYFLKYLRSVCFDFTGGFVMMIDIVNWIRTINSANQQFDPKLQKLPGAFANPIITFEKIISKDTIVLKSSSGSNIYSPNDSDTVNSKITDFAIIKLPPTGYSFFFPIEDCSKTLNRNDYANVRANVLSDDLLKLIPEWRDFLKIIDPAIDTIFP